jgi:2-polyprenyl-6-methoxyphenol hydroxylase-like FAD-dependent oxidoreductase
MDSPEVIVVGAGPVGLWLAGELGLAGVSTVVLERSPARADYTKGLTVHARTIEVLAMRGMAEVPLEHGVRLPNWHFGMLTTPIDLTVLDSPYPFVLAYPQPYLEALLERRATGLGATVLREHTVTGLTQAEDSVRVEIARPDGVYTLDAAFVVGCDGAGSTVRKAAGIGFPGTDSTLFAFLGDVTMDHPPAQGTVAQASPDGTLIVGRLPGDRYRVAGFDPQDQDRDTPMTFARLRTSVIRAAGTDFGMGDPTWLSQTGNAARQAETYRRGRVLLAGDAAHMHFPAGGVGLNVGVQDAMNLGWKLAATVQGRAPLDFLDTYHAERHPVGAALIRHTLAQTGLLTNFTAEGLALRALLAELLTQMPALSARLAGILSGLDVHYPPSDPDAHPLVGHRVPNLRTTAGDLFGLLVDGRPVLLDFTAVPGDGAVPVPGVRTVRAVDPWRGHDKLAVLLVRPDGHVAWAADADADAVTTGSISAGLAALPVGFADPDRD